MYKHLHTRETVTYYLDTLLQVNFIIADTFALNLYEQPICKFKGNIKKKLDFIFKGCTEYTS